MFKHILMATDGSELSTEAVREGLKLARQHGAKVTFLNVVTPFHVFIAANEMLTDTRAEYEKHSRQRAERVLDECREAAREADLVVMGSHRRRGIEGLLLGSQTHKTITHTRTPVLVMR